MAISFRLRFVLASGALLLLTSSPLALLLPGERETQAAAPVEGANLAGASFAGNPGQGRPPRILFAGLATSVVAFGVLGSWILGGALVRPLGRMTLVAQRIAAGDDAAAGDLPQPAGDEVGAMAAALGRMIEELRQQRTRVTAMNRELEAVVEDRTAELVRTNVALADLRLAQEQLVVADRRASLGRLAAGVGHEINNPLSYVIGNLEWVCAEMKAQQTALVQSGRTTPEEENRLDAMNSALLDASEGASRIKAIVGQLQAFTLGAADDRIEPIRISDALDLALTLLGVEIKHRARLSRVDLGAPAVRANLVRLSQVFVNLLVNAAHAIPEGARDRHEIRTTVGADPQGRAYVEIQDTGCGIPKEDMERLFTPFFTTRPAGQGTGLGLSVSLAIVRAFGGDITVESELQRGSSFRVVLPACSEPPISVPMIAPEVDAPRLALPLTRRGRILVVDDDPPVAEAMTRLLDRRHRATMVNSGREALRLIAGGERFDLILCDLMMPAMSGMALHAALASSVPGQAERMIFITGGVFTSEGFRFLETMKGRWMTKPLDVEQLGRFVEERLLSA